MDFRSATSVAVAAILWVSYQCFVRLITDYVAARDVITIIFKYQDVLMIHFVRKRRS
jgi:hypothetical protein